MKIIKKDIIIKKYTLAEAEEAFQYFKNMPPEIKKRFKKCYSIGWKYTTDKHQYGDFLWFPAELIPEIIKQLTLTK